MRISASPINFKGQPNNYSIIDKYVSRSAQPKKEDFLWLKNQGVTDIFNFRTMYISGLNFNEEETVKNLGLKYHQIPSITSKPSEANINLFLNKIEEIKKRGGKAHIHCKAGADRTGMYAFIYKVKNGIGTILSNQLDWLQHGHDYNRYPNLVAWATNFVKKNIK